MADDDQEHRFLCKFCYKSFSSGNSLGGHMRGHLALINAQRSEDSENGDLGFDREEADKEKKVPLLTEMDFEDAGEASYNLRENPKRSWRISPSKHHGDLKNMNFCKQCGKGFPSLKALAGHMRSHSAKGKQETAVCKECGKVFDSMRAMFGHMRSHSKRSRASSEPDCKIACPVKKKRSTNRYNNVTSNVSNSQSDSLACFTEVDEVKEVAMCLMMLSRGVRCLDEFSLIVDTSKDCSSVILGSWSSFRKKGCAGKQEEDESRPICGGIETRKMMKPRGINMDSSVSRFDNFGSRFDSNDEHIYEFDVSDDQSLSSDIFEKTPDMKKGMVIPVESSLKNLVTEVGCEQVDVHLHKAHSSNKVSFTDNQFEFKGHSSDDHPQCATSASVILEDYESKGKFKCKTCGKTFSTHQALGGHRTTHKTVDSCITVKEENCIYVEADSEHEKVKGNETSIKKCDLKRCKEHECSICFKVFATGQALGGHKRAHYIGLNDSRGKAIDLMEQDLPDHIDNHLDLNIPAATTEEESSTRLGLKPWWAVNDFDCEPMAIFN